MSVASVSISVRNLQAIGLAEVPVVSLREFREELCHCLDRNSATLVALFGVPQGSQHVRIFAAVHVSLTAEILLMATDVGDHYEALTPAIPQAHWFEREIAEQWGVVPDGHPWLKPIRFHASYRTGRDAWGRSADEILPAVLPKTSDYFRVEGEEVHEVAVGPVHAGVIEPGHFRFQCHGEHVFNLEIELGFQHRGIERKLVGGPDKRTLHYMETLAGDTTIGHTTAYCQLMEAFRDVEPPLRAQAIRAVALELERLANHTGDLGALAGDVGFLPTLSYCGRIRGDFLNATALICGNRFGRSLVIPGGVRFDVDSAMSGELRNRVASACDDAIRAVGLLWSSSSVMARFENVGVVPFETAKQLGIIGLAGRASGNDRDVRRDAPSGFYRYAHIPVSTWHSGDAFARAYVRYLEIKRSGEFLADHLDQLPQGDVATTCSGMLRPSSIGVSLVEGWRGVICHVAMTDDDGRIAHYKIVDPSFHNWIGLAMALRDQQISDFPLCNKSFNLSYCGHDL